MADDEQQKKRDRDRVIRDLMLLAKTLAGMRRLIILEPMRVTLPADPPAVWPSCKPLNNLPPTR
jgi:hypothetical protein